MYSLLFLPILNLPVNEPKIVNFSKYFTDPIAHIYILDSSNVNISPLSSGNIFFLLRKKVGKAKLKFVFNSGNSSVKDILLLGSRTKKVLFKYKSAGNEKNVYLAGSFNSFNPKSIKMERKGEYFEKEIDLNSGIYQYKFVVDGNWFQDPKNPNKSSDGFGGFNSVIEVEGENFFVNDINESTFTFSKPVTDAIVIDGDKILTRDKYSLKNGILKLKIGNEKHFFRIIGIDDIGNPSYPFAFAFPQNDFKGRIIYFAMTDRFFDGEKNNDKPVRDAEVDPRANFIGGDFTGITEKIENGYFDSLGIGVLWISPVIKNPDKACRDVLPPHRKFTGYHGYWPVDFYKIDDRFGTLAELKKLVKKAHKHNILVFLDMVFNHTHIDNPIYKKHKNWFTSLILPDGSKNIRRFDEHPYTTWFDIFLPSFDYENSDSAIQYMIKNGVYWIAKTDADGFRLDAVKHIPHKFWRELRSAIQKKFKVRVWFIGETISSRDKILDWISPSELDGQFDFPLYWVIRDCFGRNRSFKDLAQETMESINKFSAGIWAPLLGNHDFGRFISLANGDLNGNEKEIAFSNPPGKPQKRAYKMSELAFAFLLTQSGNPLIYYGDEIGLPGAGDPDNRRMMKFNGLSNNEMKLFSSVKKLGKERKLHPSLSRGRFFLLKVDNNYIIYLKKYFNDMVIVGINKSKKEIKKDVKFPEFLKKHHIQLFIPPESFILQPL